MTTLHQLKERMKRLVCLLLGHKYYLVRVLTDNGKLIGCKRCGKFYGVNDDVRAILPFDEDLCNLYTSLKTYRLRGLRKYITKDPLFNLITG
jgi:hypothetical protein